VSKFRPPRRSGWRAPWVAGVLAVLIAAALAGAGAAAGAQEATTTSEPAASAPDQNAADQNASDQDAADQNASDQNASDQNAADQNADANADSNADANADSTDTTVDDGNQAADPDNDPNGNINNLPLNSGIQTGTVFNPTPYGEVPGKTPQVLVLRPGSGRIIPLNRELNIRARFSNFEPGHFSDPKLEYGKGTQRLNGEGELEGHNHACFQRVARDGSVPAETCDSFVVMSQEGTSDILTGIAPPLTRPGRYRLCVDAAAENHYPAARAFAQRGGPVDCVRVLAMDVSQLRAQPAANQ
jgi:hypothetical protein